MHVDPGIVRVLPTVAVAALPCIGVQEEPIGCGNVGKGGGLQEQATFIRAKEHGPGEILSSKGIHKENIIVAAAWNGQQWPLEGEWGLQKGLPCMLDPARGSKASINFEGELPECNFRPHVELNQVHVLVSQHLGRSILMSLAKDDLYTIFERVR